MADSSPDHTTPDFGTNQWLVEEMYERFQEDPASVDPTWAALFKDGAVTGGAPPSTNGTAPKAPVAETVATPAAQAAAPAAPSAPPAPAAPPASSAPVTS